jgi:SulP family sulfate permease
LCRNSRKEKIEVILSGVKENVHESLKKSAIPQLIGEENICSNIHLAVERAKVLTDDETKKDLRKEKR